MSHKPDTIIVSREVFEILRDGEKDDATHTPTNRKARRAAEAERKRRHPPPHLTNPELPAIILRVTTGDLFYASR